VKVVFKGQVPKDLSFPDSIEDAMAFSIDSDRIAISDGASESFDSRTWAQLIVQNYITDPSINSSWLSAAAGKFAENFDVDALSWSKAAAFERGSFATLLGLEYFQAHCDLEVISVGDCMAVLLDGVDLVQTFPYQSSEQFQQRPVLFCSNITNNNFIQDSNFYTNHQITWNLKNLRSPKILCMTDALGEWALRNAAEGTPKWELLLEISTNETLCDLVISERNNRGMKVDDVTLVSISFAGIDEHELPIP